MSCRVSNKGKEYRILSENLDVSEHVYVSERVKILSRTESTKAACLYVVLPCHSKIWSKAARKINACSAVSGEDCRIPVLRLEAEGYVSKGYC